MTKCNLWVENGKNPYCRRPYWKMAATATLPPAGNYHHRKSWSTHSYDYNDISHYISSSKLPRDYICPPTIITFRDPMNRGAHRVYTDSIHCYRSVNDSCFHELSSTASKIPVKRTHGWRRKTCCNCAIHECKMGLLQFMQKLWIFSRVKV